ncbi:Atromentin synthetase nps3 [Frankliniella fusca]|uniref:Atromentin synthetase nps3 n=1 Tax=Frankliniella fusca TaxID=407009 RepID=A0AAE1I2F7_9NEOP|nr:Atromentin synthetase nps3 [Frankliniella fusca]
MSDDIFEAVEVVVDEFLTPTLRPNEDSPGVPSGVSSGSGTSVDAPPPSSISTGKGTGPKKKDQTLISCTYSGCKKSYKTVKGFENHVFTHKITSLNQRRPNIITLTEAADNLVCKILEAISKESFASETKKKYVNDILQIKETKMSEWTVFVEYLSKPIIEILAQQTKLLPRNKYEDSLLRVNLLLNDKEFISCVQDKFVSLLSAEECDLKSIRLIVYHLCTQLSEEFNLLILKELREKANPVSTPLPEGGSDSISSIGTKLFNDKICTIVRSYYSKAIAIRNEVWKARCECLRLRFMTFIDNTSKNDIVKKVLWLEGKICVTEDVLEFCNLLESVVKRFMTDFKNPVIPDTIIQYLLETEDKIISIWHSLTAGYFSEMDSLLFMRDFVKIFVNLSVRSEELALKRRVGDERLQQCGTREHLKHN